MNVGFARLFYFSLSAYVKPKRATVDSRQEQSLQHCCGGRRAVLSWSCLEGKNMAVGFSSIASGIKRRVFLLLFLLVRGWKTLQLTGRQKVPSLIGIIDHATRL